MYGLTSTGSPYDVSNLELTAAFPSTTMIGFCASRGAPNVVRKIPEATRR